MADYDSSLPVRTESAGDIDAFISDATTPSQKLKVNADGSIDTNATISANDLDIRDLDAAQDNVAISDGTEQLEINADGSINVVSTATDLDIRDLAASQDNVAISDGTEQLEINADGSINAVVSATDLDVRDLDAVSDSVAAHLFDEAGAAFSLSNPLPVQAVSDAEGAEICEFNTSSSVAKDASVNHDYTVTAATTFLGKQAWISGSGKLKAEVIVNSVTKYVGFNSTANPNIEIPLHKILKANATEVIRITITNRDNQPQDVYSTLSGLEV